MEYTINDIQKVIKKISKRFNVTPKNIPLEELILVSSLDCKSRSSKKKIIDLINQRECGYFKKDFELGKVYAEKILCGVKEDKDIPKLVENLVYGLISNKQSLILQSHEDFDKQKIENARRYVSAKEVYKNIRNNLENLKSEYEGNKNAREIINFFSKRYLNVRDLMDLLDGIEGEKADYLIARMQRGTFHDLFHNSKLGACTFYPNGCSREDALNYSLDRDVGLLHLIPLSRKKEREPIGVAICLHVQDEEKNKGILVDSYEQGEVFKIGCKVWSPIIEQGLKGIAADPKAKFIIVNSNTVSTDNGRLLSHIKRTNNARNGEHYAKKINGTKDLEKYGGIGSKYRYLESFGLDDGYYTRNKKTEGKVEGIRINL
ncbi:MAG: hypothetical protein V1660_01195 [archaeon]